MVDKYGFVYHITITGRVKLCYYHLKLTHKGNVHDEAPPHHLGIIIYGHFGNFKFPGIIKRSNFVVV